jgi:monomeric isocitrate dehydrogenase
MSTIPPPLSFRAPPSAAAVGVSLDQLMVGGLLLQAGSGGGKSRAIRQLLEETHGRVQHLVIDPEGEFASLRERFDYVHAAPHGADVVATPKTARVLCRRLVEIGASAVLDIYDLKAQERSASSCGSSSRS